ncbi:hypothetical protein [Rhodococcus sp. IEGM 1330]|uniref:hypothetical protein n=1 Tax=Rhodococcus sp. IEGM 1330 TaxID=3082225 RepID=UPI0029553221|nr:hypothetical protein [Rhodococcus sp. IEGM 1330]MDV8022176.1 hypothetical protein [Rhodococcus sp. IEGM 1330]
MNYPGSGDPSQRAYGQYGAQPNPSDRVIPPPSSGPGAPQSRATAQPGGYGAVPRPPVFGTGGFPGAPPPGPPRKGNGGIWIVVAVLAVVAVILGGVFAWSVARDDATPAVASAGAAPSSAVSDGSVPGGEPAPTAANSPQPGVATLPAGAQTCPATVASSSGLRGSAVGSSVTSCPFAEEVRLAYTRAGSDRNSRTVVASSPVTGKRYEMNCVSSAQLVTCTGGENAVVYLF